MKDGGKKKQGFRDFPQDMKKGEKKGEKKPEGKKGPMKFGPRGK
jgi:hypothetical protein